jgi:hypothetical protein
VRGIVTSRAAVPGTPLSVAALLASRQGVLPPQP